MAELQVITAWHSHALQKLTARDYSAAAEAFEECLADDEPPSVDLLNDAAVALYHAGDGARAFTLLNRALERDPGHPSARLNQFYFEHADEHRTALTPVELAPRTDSDPRVSVLMPTYNRPDSIRESIASVLAQEFTDFELVIVNDGGTRAVEKTLEDFDDARIRYHYAAHGGLSHALNAGLGRARGKFIAYLDDDDIYYPNHLSVVMKHFDAHPDSAVAYTDVNRATYSRVRDEMRLTALEPHGSIDFDPSLYLERNYTPVLSVVHRRDCIDTTDAFNTSIEFGMDWDMWIRMSRVYEFAHVPELTGEFRWRDDGATMSTTHTIRREYYNNLIAVMHGGVLLTSGLFDATHPRTAALAWAAVRDVLDAHADALSLIPLSRLPRTRHPYKPLNDAGRALVRSGRPRAAGAFFAAARRVAPWEPKLYAASVRAWVKWLMRGEAG